MNDSIKIKSMPLWESILLFLIPSGYFIFIAYIIIPYFNKSLGLHPALSWFFGGYLVFVPLFLLALILVKREGNKFTLQIILERFRIRKLSKNDWKWTAISSVLILLFTGLIMYISRVISIEFGVNELETTPPFMQFQTLQGYEKFYLFVWLPMFFFNIVGEEILWRGYILPRQEKEHGRYAWIVNAALWLVFHICFGLDLMIILLPIMIIVPFTAQKTKNTAIGIITHALLNGPMFVLVSLGIV